MFDLAKFGLMLFLAAGGLTAVGIKWRNYKTDLINQGAAACKLQYETQNNAIIEEKTKENATQNSLATQNINRNATVIQKVNDALAKARANKEAKPKVLENMLNEQFKITDCLSKSLNDENKDNDNLCLD